MKFLALWLLSILVISCPGFSQTSKPSDRKESKTINQKPPVSAYKKKKKSPEKKEKSKETDYQWEFLAGPDMAFGFPVGIIRDSLHNGLGFNAKGEYLFLPNVHFGLNTGFRSYKYDPVMVGDGHFTYIPVRLSATYFPFDYDFKPYASLGLGVFFTRVKIDAEFLRLNQNHTTGLMDTLFYQKKQIDQKQTSFGITPAIGVMYEFLDSFVANVGISYDLILAEKSSNFLGINLGVLYRFGF